MNNIIEELNYILDYLRNSSVDEMPCDNNPQSYQYGYIDGSRYAAECIDNLLYKLKLKGPNNEDL